CACSRFQVTPKTSHLSAVKRIFWYLKGKPKLGIWYPRVSSFDLEAYSSSDYAGANLDRKSTTGDCQFLNKRLISWQCKKQTIVATSTTEAEYVAAASCCGQVLWIQNQIFRGLIAFRELLRRINNGTKALLLPTLFILWLDKVSTDCLLNLYKPISIAQFCTHSLSKLLSHLQALISLFTTISLSSTMAVLDSCPKHNMVAYLEKSEGNAEFHEIIDFLKRSSIHHAETENAQNKGRTREMVDADKEIDENILSTENVLSTDKDGVSTDMKKVSTNRQIVSTDGSKGSTDRQNEGTEEKNEGIEEKNKGTEEHIEGTEENFEGTEEHIEGTGEQVESTGGQKKGIEEEIAAQATQTPTSKIFGDDESIAKV
ncbi:hypothetical protein Tco_1495112, partial [Tanacetum coccineum]